MLKKIGFILLIILFLSSCGNEKVIQLPEVKNAKITEVLDVSPAYIFYDESKPDSVELNRKNLIISTNWLFNVDKRLTLEQAIPKIKFLQDKKRHAKMHKNEAAKNYYTCNDTSIKNLGFIDFTEVEYHLNSNKSEVLNFAIMKAPTLLLEFRKNKQVLAFDLFAGKSNKIGFFDPNTIELEKFHEVFLCFDKEINFQDYISTVSKMKNLFPKIVSINNNEFIF